MAWIESHTTLREHPKRKRLSRLLGINARETIGLLHVLWWWALDFATEGDLSEFSDEDIADSIDWEGDAEQLLGALTQSGFIDANRQIHDWDEFAEKWIERRRANAERMRVARAKRNRDPHSKGAQHVHDTFDARAAQKSKSVGLPDRTGPDRTGPDQPDRSAGAPAAAAPEVSANGLAHDEASGPAIPESLASFHAVMRSADGYEPSSAFLEQVSERYVALDLREEALKIVDWLADPERNPKHKRASTRFVLGWLRRELTSQATKATEGRSSATGARNGQQEARAQRQSPVPAANGAGRGPGWHGAPTHPAPVKVEEF